MTKSTVFQAGKIVCFMLILVLLLIPFTITIKEVSYALPPTEKTRTEISSESDYLSKNFYDYISYLKLYDWSPNAEIWLIVFVVACLVVSLFELWLKKNADYNKIKVFAVLFCIINLIVIILLVILQMDNDMWNVVNIETVKLDNYPNWKFFVETQIQGKYNLIMPILLSICSLVLHCALNFEKIIKDNNYENNNNF